VNAVAGGSTWRLSVTSQCHRVGNSVERVEEWVLLYELNAKLNCCKGFDILTWRNALLPAGFSSETGERQKTYNDENRVVFQLAMIIGATAELTISCSVCLPLLQICCLLVHLFFFATTNM
jgi:hypothetical protein